MTWRNPAQSIRKSVKNVGLSGSLFVITPTPDTKTHLPPPKPSYPCPNCKSDKWWLRTLGWGSPEWLCSICHPNPNIEKEGDGK